MSGGVSVACPAKINLLLRVLAREDGGHHQIETVFQAVDLCDQVEARPGDSGIALEVRCDRAGRFGDVTDDLGDPDRNTVTLAARAFFAATGRAPSARIALTKAVPAGTGLGGASSDAAGALIALNALHGDPLDRKELLALGRSVGSDVPFFLAGKATAIAWGRGDRLLPRSPPGSAAVVLVVPSERSPTARAYRELSARMALPAAPAVLDGASAGGWSALGALQGNDFEQIVFERVPRLRAMRRALAEGGAMVARMTGSGTALFGVFEDDREAGAVAAKLEAGAESADVAVVRTLARMPSPKPIRR